MNPGWLIGILMSWFIKKCPYNWVVFHPLTQPTRGPAPFFVTKRCFRFNLMNDGIKSPKNQVSSLKISKSHSNSNQKKTKKTHHFNDWLYMGVSKNNATPNHPLTNMVFHEIHHPFLGKNPPIFGLTSIWHPFASFKVKKPTISNPWDLVQQRGSPGPEYLRVTSKGLKMAIRSRICWGITKRSHETPRDIEVTVISRP